MIGSLGVGFLEGESTGGPNGESISTLGLVLRPPPPNPPLIHNPFINPPSGVPLLPPNSPRVNSFPV
jgi:hypothetical protein